jgi:outer membrane protein assembly factor BamC
MSHLLKTVTVVSLSVLLSACSTSHESKRQITGNEDYLKASDVKPLAAPAGMVLPLQYGDYTIPDVQTNGVVGKALDIRPPQQPLSLLPGSRAQAQNNQAEIRFENPGLNLNGLMQAVISAKKYPISNSGVDQATDRLYWTTDWISWHPQDEKYAYEARYEISAVGNGYSNIIHVKLNELRSQGQAVATPAEISRYTVMMLNSLTESIYVEQNRQSAQAAAAQVGTFTVQSANDETGLPLVVVRSPYAVVWQALPTALSNVGMTVSDSNRANGQITLKYKSLSKSQLESLNVQDVALKGGEYTLQVGDLGNRTSLQFRSSKGQPVNSEDNESLVALMQAAFNQVRQN